MSFWRNTKAIKHTANILKDAGVWDYSKYDNPVCKTATRLMNMHQKEIEHIAKRYSRKGVHPTVLFYPSEDVAFAWVHQNIVLNPKRHIYRGSVYHPCASIFEPLADDINSNPNKYYVNGSFRRGIRRVNQRTKMAWSRVFTRFVQWDSPPTDDAVRDLAQSITNLLKPVSITFCETAKDYLTMYSTGPKSCMSLNNYDRNWSWMVEEGYHPTQFYHYCPVAKGAYLAVPKNDTDTVVARTILWKTGPGDTWGYTRLYYSDGESRDDFLNQLEKLGIRRLDSYATSVSFDMPIIKSDRVSSAVVPIPYFDGVSFKLYMEEKDSDAVTVHMSPYYCNIGTKIDTHLTSGFLPMSRIKQAKCSACGSSCGDALYAVQDDSSKMFCSASCYTSSGYVAAIRSDGIRVLLSNTTAGLIHNVQEGEWYTNSRVAEDAGCFPVLDLRNSLEENYYWGNANSNNNTRRLQRYTVPEELRSRTSDSLVHMLLVIDRERRSSVRIPMEWDFPKLTVERQDNVCIELQPLSIFGERETTSYTLPYRNIPTEQQAAAA